MKKNLVILIILILGLLFSVSYAVTPSFTYKDLLYDPRAMGMAGAMTALADSPTSAIYNPALVGEYSLLTLKLGIGAYPIDKTNLENFNEILNYIKILNNNQEPPNGELSAGISSAGYLHLGISKLGLTLFGDGDFNFYYYKYKSEDPDEDLQLEGNITIDIATKANGALTVAIPAFDLLGFKINIGANARLVNEFYVSQYLSVKATYSGVTESSVTGEPNENNYYNNVFNSSEKRYLTIDLGTYIRFTPFLAAGLVVKDAYAIPLEGKYTIKTENGYFTWDGSNMSLTTTSSESSGSLEVDLPSKSLKAGVFIKVPVLATRVSVDADLNENFTPLSYRIGVEQPLTFLVVRGGAILDPSFQPQLYTLGAGVNLLLIQADTAVVLDPQNMQPIAGSISGSIKF